MTAPVNVLIVGGGAAGATCAMYLGRAGLNATVLDHGRTILKRAELHNYPGMPAIPGVEWLDAVRAQVAKTGHCTVIDARVRLIEVKPDGGFTTTTDAGEYASDYVVIASGQGQAPFVKELDLAAVEAIQPYVKVNFVVDRWGQTSTPKVFAVGVVAGLPSQAVICAGSGAAAAVRIVSLETGEFWIDHDEAAPAD